MDPPDVLTIIKLCPIGRSLQCGGRAMHNPAAWSIPCTIRWLLSGRPSQRAAEILIYLWSSWIDLWVTVAQVKAEDFFLGYRKVALEPHEILLRVSIPFNKPSEYVREFKQAHRRDDDIAIVNAGMRVQMAHAMSGLPNSPGGPPWPERLHLP